MQAGATPFLKDRMLPFLVRVALARKLEEAGRDGALAPTGIPRPPSGGSSRTDPKRSLRAPWKP